MIKHTASHVKYNCLFLSKFCPFFIIKDNNLIILIKNTFIFENIIGNLIRNGSIDWQHGFYTLNDHFKGN